MSSKGARGRSYRREGEGGRGRGRNERAVFTKLIRDGEATVRSERDIERFIEGMQTYTSKKELLTVMADKRNHFSTRIVEILEYIEDVSDITHILVPILSNILAEETNKPLFKAPRGRLLNLIYQIDGLLPFLVENDVATNLPLPQAQVICKFLLSATALLIEARNSEDVKSLALSFRERGGIDDSTKLCALLLLDKNPKPSQDMGRNEIRDEMCWVTDMVPPGERHDNDHENYRNIQLVPTRDEIACERRSWLPLANGKNLYIEDKEMSYLDSSFRLLREDAVSTMKEKIKQPVRVWKNSRIVGVAASVEGAIKMTSLFFLVQLSPMGNNHKAINWERNRALPRDGIVAFCRDGKPIKMATIFVRIHDKPGKWLNSSRGPVIGVHFDSEADFHSSLEEISRNIATENKLRRLLDQNSSKESTAQLNEEFESYDMIEVSSSFFSYKPVLAALQELQSVPFAEELVHLDSEPSPDYLPTEMKMPDTEHFNGFVCNLDNWSEEQMRKETILDSSQIDAIRVALTSRVALIQGPPGCGKSLIGSVLGQMICENTDESILCVCQTNHALDQFLEHLLDRLHGKAIVRVGGRSKSSRMKDINLTNLARKKGDKSSEAEARMRACYKQLCDCHNKMEGLMKVLIDQTKQPLLEWKKPHGGISKVLQKHDPAMYDAFAFLDEFADGEFMIVGKNNKKMTSDSLFHEWQKGSPLPQMLQDTIDMEYSANDSNQLHDIWTKNEHERKKMVEEWHQIMIESIHNELRPIAKLFEELTAEKQTISRDQDLSILKNARVIGATTNGAAKYREILAAKSCGVVIVEEAGEVLESNVISTLSDGTKHLILIGDHLQLRPKCENHSLTIVSGKGYNLDCSLFERLVTSGFPSSMLQVQHRMRPSISEFIRSQTYPSLQDHPSVHQYPKTKGVSHDVVFIDHDHSEDAANDLENKTKSNEYESKMCIEIVKYLLLQGYKHNQITILTPYVGQLLKLIGDMKKYCSDTSAYISELDAEAMQDATIEGDETLDIAGLSNSGESLSVRVSSIDNFQGEESDIIVISLVRSNKFGNIGFLKEEQRVNVLLSRAKHGLFIVGNADTLKRSKGAHVWNPILHSLKSNGGFLKGLPTICQHHPKIEQLITFPHEFKLKCPNGGCTEPCRFRLKCGHVCPLACHPIDTDHLLVHKQCSEPCRRFPPECNQNHPCPKLCKEDCGPCLTRVGDTMLPCGHIAINPTCHSVRNEDAKKELSMRCNEIVKFTFDCGHTTSTTCSNSRSEHPVCPEKCGKLLDCGHTCENNCGKCEKGHKCLERCGRTLFCGHICSAPCHGSRNCPPCQQKSAIVCNHSACSRKCSSISPSCVEPCDWECDHQGKCEMICGAPCTRLPCNERCNKMLPCGHRCPSLCGECEDGCPQDYCIQCCSEDRKKHVVEMIMFSEYQDHDLDNDPIIVLSCSHFYSTSTLDGVFGINDAYEKDEKSGLYVATKPLSGIDLKPQRFRCPDCREVVMGVKRYGRLINASSIYILERKHLMKVEQSLTTCSELINRGKASNVEKVLDRIYKEIQKSPMQKVYEACAGSDQLDVPKPPASAKIRCLQLMTRVKVDQIKEKGDGKYKKTKTLYDEAIQLCEDSKSINLGANLRLDFVQFMLRFHTVDEIGEDMMLQLDKIFDSSVVSDDTKTLARTIQDQIKTGSIAAVVKAMNVVGGYNYGGAWSSHWYECPNGHPYFIGECGGAMETSRCPECGATVGGQSHTLHSSNRPVTGAVRRVFDE